LFFSLQNQENPKQKTKTKIKIKTSLTSSNHTREILFNLEKKQKKFLKKREK